MNGLLLRRMAVIAVVLALSVCGSSLAQNVPTVIVSEKKKQEKVVIHPEVTRNLTQLNERLAGIAKLWESRELETARGEYRKILGAMSAPPHYRSYAHLRIAQSYAAEKNTAAAQAEYEKIKAQAEYPPLHRYEAAEILKEMDRLAKGLPARDVMASRTKIPPVGKFAVEFFVAPIGNDLNPGTRQHPFASLEKARDAIRALKAKGALPGPVGVHLLPGEYPMTRTLELTAADSGTETAPIVYRADKKGTAVLYGGARLSGWTVVNDPAILERLPEEARGKIFQCDLKKLGITDFGRITVAGYGKPQQPEMLLYCNGRKQTLARWPNSGYVEVKKVINPGSVKGNIQPVFEYADERHARWTKAEDPWLYSFFVYNWVPRRIPIRHIDANAKAIVIDPYGHADRDGIGTVPWQKTLPYFALNILEEIDSPGEWYLDREKGVLYLFLLSNLDSSVIELGMLSQVMVSMDMVSHVRMEHLKLDLSRGDCMTIRSGSHVLLAGCSFTRFGNNGINVPDGNAVGILGCDFSYIEDSAARINGGDRKRLVPAGHFIENCLFANLPGTAVGINGVGNRVAHNRFVDIEGSAVYGIGGLLGNDHVIEYNDVIRCGLPLDKHHGAAGDMGVMGSYGDPTYRAVYRYNRFSEIGVSLDGGHAAIRLDDAISGMVIYGNVFDRCGDSLNPKGGMGALNYNAGRDNICDNNIFIRCPKVQTGGFNPNNDCWERILRKGTMSDPLYLSRYPDLKNYQKDGVINTSGFNHLWRNVIVDCPTIVKPGFGAPIESFDVMDLAVYANQDPGFVDMAKGDYRLVKNAPVLNRIGFRPIPVEEIGLREDEYRASWPAAMDAATHGGPSGGPEAKKSATKPVSASGTGMNKQQGAVVAGIVGLMSPGIQVGHFDHDQDEAPVAAVNAEYLDSVKAAGLKSIRFFYTTDKTPAFYAANVSYALKSGLVVNLCMFAWEYNTRTEAAFAGHWKAIAEYYKDYPHELVFEMFNEPARVADAERGVIYITTGFGPNGKTYDMDVSPLDACRKEAATFPAVSIEGDTARGKAIELPSLKVIDTFEIRARR